MENNLKSKIQMATIPNMNVNYYYEQLISFPEGTWFRPRNDIHQDYQICNDLFEMNLIERRIEPIFHKGINKGNKVFFKYNLS